MPRQPRYRLAGYPQHVVQRGNDRQPTFYAPADYAAYRRFLRQAADERHCRIHAYVLMTNHVHLLVTPDSPDGLAKLMQSLGRCYVRYINDTYRRTGTLWEGRYKACLVQADSHLLGCQRYIELNPVRAGMVKRPEQYPHSSYRHNALGQADPLVAHHPAYATLGKCLEESRRIYRESFGSTAETSVVDDIRRMTNSCRVLGNDRFRDQIETILACSVRPGAAGRPRKIAV